MNPNELYLKWIAAEKEAARFPTKENREAAVRLHSRLEELRAQERKYKTAAELKIW